jgi:hypothetical protein
MLSKNSATTYLVAAALSIFLLACGPKVVRPSTPPAPPVVTCDKGPPRSDPPDWPENFVVTGAGYALQLLGIIREDRKLTANEHRCLDDLRGKGVIQ